jgi:DNA (cytosine-5)-methyltransferase 1
MMGLPDGWVTDIDLRDRKKLQLLGNGVVPQQARLALSYLETL